MSAINSFSFRQSAKSLLLKSIGEHTFEYDTTILAHMFGKASIFVEMGGLYGLSYALRTDLKTGIREDEKSENYETRVSIYGTNELPLPPVNSFFSHCLDALSDVMLIILIVAGLISIVANTIRHPSDGWIEGVAILVAVVLVTLVSAYNNHSQEVAFMKLAASLKGSRVTILRNSTQSTFEQDEILVGDIVSLNPGSMIPADGVLIDNTTIRVNESALTGEPDECIKNHSYPFMYAGTEVTDGSCQMLVTAVGVNSSKGKLMSTLAQEQEQTNLQKRLEEAATLIGYIGLSAAIITFLALLIRWVILCETDANYSYSEDWTEIIDYFIIAVTILVVAIPEGLPLAVTVSLAYSMAKMRADQNLVKVLSACETMGNATCICSDKTGTLTQNKMKVVQMYLSGTYYARQAHAEEINPAIHKLLIDSIVCNSDRRVEEANMDFGIIPEDWTWEGDGGATETALLAWLSRYHLPSEGNPHIMQLRSKEKERTMLFYPFSSAKKVSSVIMALEGDEDIESGRRYYKGAADRVIKSCTSMINSRGEKVDVGSFVLAKCQIDGCKREAMRGPSADKLSHCDQHSESGQHQFDGVCRFSRAGQNCNKWAVMGTADGEAEYCTDVHHHPAGANFTLKDQHPYKIMSNMTRVGLRCIAFAYVDGVKLEIVDNQLVEPAEIGDWTLIGLVGIKDPLRSDTRDSVLTVQQAGVVVRMVTGDNIDTARFIAEDCGIISHPRHIALEGGDFRQHLEQQEAYKAKNGVDNPDFVELIRNLRVMARCQPEDKLELVKFLKEHGDVVGVTGDGSNDGPALKEANVGLCMGSGTDVSKAAADIIILDDSFGAIVKSIMWGRAVFDNIRKFLQFQCSVNVCALALAMIGAMTAGTEPLKPVQLLFVNLIMDTFGALALGTETPRHTLLQRKPYRPDGPLISKVMWRNILGQGLFQLTILLVIMYAFKSNYVTAGVYDEDGHLTLIYNCFVWMQFFNEINSRKVNAYEMNIMENFFDNWMFLFILAITALMQVAMVEGINKFASTVPQSAELWFIAIGVGFTQILTGLLLRFWNPDPTEGQLVIDPETFEGLAWNESCIESLFPGQGKKEKNDSKDLENNSNLNALGETNDYKVNDFFSSSDGELNVVVYN